MRKALGYAVVLGCALAGCRQNTLSKVPQISDLVLVPDSIRVTPGSRDTAFLQFRFTDGDGDLGSSQGDIFIRDVLSAKPVERFLMSDQLEEVVDPELGLKGTTTVVLPAAFALFEIADTTVLRDTVQLEVYLRDKAGNESNRLTTRPLQLIK